MKTNRLLFYALLAGLTVFGCRRAGKPKADQALTSTPENRLMATVYNSGFSHSHDTYNGLSTASDGKVYYVLCSELMDVAGQMYSFDPRTRTIEHLGDLTEMCGEKGMNVVSQGKSHVNFYEYKGKLYFATHLGYYSIIDGMEKTGIPSNGYQAYRGGHFLAFDIKDKTVKELAIAPDQEGILSMCMDTGRGLIYGLTWPTGLLIRYDVTKGELKNLGPITGKGETGLGAEFRVVCRSLVVNPDDGALYLTTADGEIKRLRLGEEKVETMADEDMRKDYFGVYEVSTAGSMAYNWRQVFWYGPEKQIYGVHGNSGYLFRFDPAVPRLEVLDRLTSIPSQRSGMNDQFSYGYLGFKLGPDQRTLYYLTGAPIYVNGQRLRGAATTAKGEAKGLEDLHLITFDIPTKTYRDHGAVFYPDGQRPLYVNSIAIGEDGTVYTLARITENGKTRTDLISFPGPLKN